MTQQPQAKYRHDYRAPDYTTTDIDLDFDLDAETTRVTAVSKIKRQGAAGAPLVLNGEDLTLVSIQVDGQAWSAYRLQDNQLLIDELPAQFTLTIVNDIHPAKNTALEGLYLSGEALCTQCEAEASATLPIIRIVRTCWRALPPALRPIKRAIRSCCRTATGWAGRTGPWPPLGAVAGSVPETLLSVCAGGR